MVSSAKVPVTKVVDCGVPQVVGQLRPRPGEVCFEVRNVCDVAAVTALPTDPRITTTATFQRNPDGAWTRIATNCAALAAKPQLTALVVLEQVRKLVPRPRIGVAPPGGATLVNIQTLLWLDTPADQSLGVLTLLGHRVALRIHLEHVDWDFGDGHRDTTGTPGRAYDPGDGCHTATCRGYWGHVYDAAGPVTITAAVTWSGQYRVARGAWRDIAETVTGPTEDTGLSVKQARGILIANPDRH